MNVREKLLQYTERRKEEEGESFIYEEPWAGELNSFCFDVLTDRLRDNGGINSLASSGFDSYPEDLDNLEPDDEKLDTLWARWIIEKEEI